jgi:hypothetical protein
LLVSACKSPQERRAAVLIQINGYWSSVNVREAMDGNPRRKGRALQKVRKEVVGIHILLTRSLFACDILRKLLGRASLAKPTSAPVRCGWLRGTKPQFGSGPRTVAGNYLASDTKPRRARNRFVPRVPPTPRRRRLRSRHSPMAQRSIVPLPVITPLTPPQVADLYDFPRSPHHVGKETIGLLEFSDPVIGTCGYWQLTSTPISPPRLASVPGWSLRRLQILG